MPYRDKILFFSLLLLNTSFNNSRSQQAFWTQSCTEDLRFLTYAPKQFPLVKIRLPISKLSLPSTVSKFVSSLLADLKSLSFEYELYEWDLHVASQ